MPAPVRLPSVWNISMIIYIIVSLSRRRRSCRHISRLFKSPVRKRNGNFCQFLYSEQKNRDRSEYALPFRLCDFCNFFYPGVSQSKLFHISFPEKDRENTNAVSCRTLPHFRHPIKNRKCSYLCRAMAGEDLQDKTP